MLPLLPEAAAQPVLAALPGVAPAASALPHGAFGAEAAPVSPAPFIAALEASRLMLARPLVPAIPATGSGVVVPQAPQVAGFEAARAPGEEQDVPEGLLPPSAPVGATERKPLPQSGEGLPEPARLLAFPHHALAARPDPLLMPAVQRALAEPVEGSLDGAGEPPLAAASGMPMEAPAEVDDGSVPDGPLPRDAMRESESSPAGRDATVDQSDAPIRGPAAPDIASASPAPREPADGGLPVPAPTARSTAPAPTSGEPSTPADRIEPTARAEGPPEAPDAPRQPRTDARDEPHAPRDMARGPALPGPEGARAIPPTDGMIAASRDRAPDPPARPSAAAPPPAERPASAVTPPAPTTFGEGAVPAMPASSPVAMPVPPSTARAGAALQTQPRPGALPERDLAPRPALPDPAPTSPQPPPEPADALSQGETRIVRPVSGPIEPPAAAAASAPPFPAPAANAAGPVEIRSDARLDARITGQVEAAIEQLAGTREGQRNLRPEVTVRHSDFGPVNLRLEVTGSDLRATLTARDPGFVPAVRQALAERGGFERGGFEQPFAPNVARVQEPSGAAAANLGSGAQAHGGGQASGQNASPHGAQAEPRYGSSPGSGQGSPQPYFGQSEGEAGRRGREPVPHEGDTAEENGRGRGRGNGRANGSGQGLYA